MPRWRSASRCVIVFSLVIGYYYVQFSRMIDARMHGEFQRTDPRIFARPLDRPARPARHAAADDRSAQRSRLRTAFAGGTARASSRSAATRSRSFRAAGDQPGQTVRLVVRARRPRRAAAADASTAIEAASRHEASALDAVALDAPLLTALVSEGREKRRDVPLAAIPPRMIQAVLAIEDRRFYDHPGVDRIGTTRAVFTNIFGSRKYLSGGSTITQQLVQEHLPHARCGASPRRGRRIRAASSPSG